MSEHLSELPGRSFERRVVDAYRAMGYQVTHDIELPGKQTDLIARRELEGAPPVTLAIECKDESAAIGGDDVNLFISRVVSQRASHTISGGVMVSASGFTSRAKPAAEGHPYISLLSWDDLVAQILDVRHRIRDLIDRYEQSPIHGSYLPMRVEGLSWSDLSGGASMEVDLDDLLAAWLDPSPVEHNSLFVLADFGAGKTTLLRRLQYERAKAYMSGEDVRVPLFVQLRDFRDSKDIITLLRASFRDSYHRDLPNDLIWQRVQDGRFHLLLDGFDEMVERSDVRRRLDLFHHLLKVLRSPSPAVLTSRPSYFVGRKELDRLLFEFRDTEKQISNPVVPNKGGNSVAADRLRRKLVDRLRENPLSHAASQGLNARGVSAVRLLSMDRNQIEAFVSRRAEELTAVGSTPTELMEFIDRTYDLTDLASRPMLLELIVQSVLLGELNLRDTDAQYGASGLYEIYTHAKLQLDLDKGRSRQGGLTMLMRRRIAEELAMKLYAESRLETEFAPMFRELVKADSSVEAELSESGLTAEEIATDFATCSFVTLDGNGKCRFVHKSFRGFFVARVLKDLIATSHPFLSEWLEREVLYFLGGFAPTQPGVGEGLWAKFVHSPTASAVLKRNMLVAYLYSKPEHEGRRIIEAEVADAEYHRLTFVGSTMKEVTWRNCTVADLSVREPRWTGVRFVDANVARMAVRGGVFGVSLNGTTVEALKMGQATAVMTVAGSALHDIEVDHSNVELVVEGAHVGSAAVRGGSFDCRGSGRGATIEHLSVSDGELHLRGPIDGEISTSRSIVTIDDSASFALGDCTSSVVVLAGSTGGEIARPHLASLRGLNEGSVVVSPLPISPSVIDARRCGVFGSLVPDVKLEEITWSGTPWGVLRYDLVTHDRVDGCDGLRIGQVLLASSRWYDRELSETGQLSAVGKLLTRTSTTAEMTPSPLVGDDLVNLLAQVRAQYAALTHDRWEPVRLTSR